MFQLQEPYLRAKQARIVSWGLQLRPEARQRLSVYRTPRRAAVFVTQVKPEFAYGTSIAEVFALPG